MLKLTYRNSHGELVDPPAVTATRVKNQFGSILEQATHGSPVAITRHAMPKAVLLSYKEFESLVKQQTNALDDLSAEFDELLMHMQTPKAQKGMKMAFEASPTQLGQVAAKAV
ncbi:MAG: hypothetical protein NPIRA02_11140 [Nitrospirales bacterium]|nr:MAG: hypothetical protein NPIRA02_11140 [Nitrospirales bacterium]